MPSSSLPPAVKEVIISEAPLENANRVTPAKISESPKDAAIFPIAGLRYFSAVEERK